LYPSGSSTKAIFVVVSVGGQDLRFQRNVDALALEALHGLLEAVYREGHVGVAVALVVGLGSVVVVRELEHGLRGVGLQREEVVGG